MASFNSCKDENDMDEATRQSALFFLSTIPLSLKEADDMLNRRYSSQCTEISSTSNYAFQAEEWEKNEVSSEENQPSYSLHPSTVSLFTRSISSTSPSQSLCKHTTRSISLIGIDETSDPNLPTLGFVKKGQVKNPVRKIKYITNKALQRNRILLVEPDHNTSFALFSVIPFMKDGSRVKSHVSPTRHTAGPPRCINDPYENNFDIAARLFIVQQNEEVSYESLLQPSKYEPVSIDLDSSQWTYGKHRTVLSFNGYLVSIIDYTKPSELKRNLNQKFKETFPSVTITLSKIRSLEKLMVRSAKSFGLESAIVTCAKNCFERLAFCSVLTKVNRHDVAASCLLLSAKIHGDLKPGDVPQLINSLQHSFKSNCSSILRHEFIVFAALQFSMIMTGES